MAGYVVVDVGDIDGHRLGGGGIDTITHGARVKDVRVGRLTVEVGVVQRRVISPEPALIAKIAVAIAGGNRPVTWKTVPRSSVGGQHRCPRSVSVRSILRRR